VSGIYGLTADMIAHQMTPALQAFILHHKDNLSFIDIVGKPFCKTSKDFQAEYLRVSAIYEVLRRQSDQGLFVVTQETTPAAPTLPTGPKAVDGQWVW